MKRTPLTHLAERLESDVKDDTKQRVRRRRRRDDANLGRTQVLVLRLLANLERPPTAMDLAYHWPSLTESSARSAALRLADRGLVDRGPYDGGSTYILTQRGRAVVTALDRDDEVEDMPEDEDASA